jgi:hypothetical protein
MVVIEEEAQVQVIFLLHPPEALEERLGYFLHTAGLVGARRETVLRIHAVRGARWGEDVDRCRRVFPEGLLKYGLVGGVKDDARTSADGKGDVFLAITTRSCVPSCFW